METTLTTYCKRILVDLSDGKDSRIRRHREPESKAKDPACFLIYGHGQRSINGRSVAMLHKRGYLEFDRERRTRSFRSLILSDKGRESIANQEGVK